MKTYCLYFDKIIQMCILYSPLQRSYLKTTVFVLAYITATDVFFFFFCIAYWCGKNSFLVQYAYLRNSMHYVFFCLQFHRETRLLGNWCTVHIPCKLRLKDAADINFHADNSHLNIFVFSNIQWVELSSQTHIGT